MTGDAPRPNILLIMADDMGFSDIGCYGGEIQTPNLDRLAGGGIRFTQFYNTGRCCPTRASLLTGLYPHQAGVGHMMDDRGLDGYRGNLNKNCRTIAEVLGTAGYANYISGKWHVTRHTGPKGPKFNWPRQRGFDRFYGTITGAGSFYDPATLTRDNTQIAPAKDDFFYTDVISRRAATFITDHAGQQPEKPFFLYVGYTAPHWPMHARPHNMAKYKGVYQQGWDRLRTDRHRRMIDLGIVDRHWAITPRDRHAPSWTDTKQEQKQWYVNRMQVYAAMIDCMDQGIGTILDALNKTGQSENTIVLFLADNGGCAEEYGTGKPYKPRSQQELKPMKPGQLQQDITPKFTRDGRRVRQGRGVMAGPADTAVSYGLQWANASNTPFRLYKHFVHEGGIASPLVVHWPAGIPKKQYGLLYHEPAHLIDIMATCVDLAGAQYPAEANGEPITAIQGVTLKPALTNQTLGRPNPLFWEHEGNRAMRDGNWKLVAKGARGKWELYDIDADRTELNNLAQKFPQRAGQMAAAWDAWAVDAKAKPWPWK